MTSNSPKHDYKLLQSRGQTIIFLNGFRMNFSTWAKVYPELVEQNNVLLYNRLGVGTSNKAIEDQSGEVVVDNLHRLLKQLELKPPYLLVAHSLGGIFANQFARTYPSEISGIVFVESAHPSEIIEQKKFKPNFLVRMINDAMKFIEKRSNPYKYSEADCIEQTDEQLKQLNDFPEIPVSIVTGTKKMPLVPEESFNLHLSYQTELLDLSENSKQFLCAESGHFPQITEAEKVVEAIQDTLSRIKLIKSQ